MQQQPQPELLGRLNAPLNRGQREGAFYSITLDQPHQGRTRATLCGETSGWSKVKQRLGKSELHEGDPVIIRLYRVNADSVAALEIC